MCELCMQPAVQHASGQCIISKGKQERMEMLLKIHRNASKLLPFLVPHCLSSLSHLHNVFLPYSCVVERGVSRWTCPVALRTSRCVMPAALCAHTGNMQSLPASLSVIIHIWALDFTFNYQKLVKKKTKTNHTHKKIQARTQEIQIYSQAFERLTIPHTHIHMLVKQPFKVVGVVSYKSSI